jgi:hypothetical protein
MERPFQPAEVEMALARFGIEGHQVLLPESPRRPTGFGVGRWVRIERARRAERRRDQRDSEWRRGTTENFTILGVKVR